MEKNFILRCAKCRWARMSTGLSSDLADLKENKGCESCGKGRNFKCPKCGQNVKLLRVKKGS